VAPLRDRSSRVLLLAHRRPRAAARRRVATLRGGLAFLVLLLGVLGMAPIAAAQDRGYGVVTLDLRLDDGDVPSHLCVVSEAPSPRTRERLWDLLETDSDDAPGSGSWRVKPRMWGGDEASALTQQCTAEPLGDCRPRVELPRGLSRHSDLYVACTADSLTEGGGVTEPRPLFILLEYLEGSPPQIESVRLTGGVATIGVYGASFDRVVVTARSLGGAYLPHRRSERGKIDPGEDATPGSKTIQLRLAARCQTVEIRLPRLRLTPHDRARMRVHVHGLALDTERCVSNLVGSEVIQIRMPPAPLGLGTIDVELAETAEQPAARFGGTFEGSWPKTPFRLAFNQVTFSWRRPDCIYPEDRCPAATLETGTLCAATVTETGCNYRCPGAARDENAIDLELPLDVTFEKTDPKQRWADTIAQNGQELTSYVPSDQIYLEANLNNWRTEIPDNRIGRVEIYGEDGEARQYGVTRIDRRVLKVPGASCESVQFKPIGDRAYDDVVALVDDGKLVFGDPHRSARRINFNVTLALGGGPAWSGPIDTPPIYFSGLGMFAVQYRSRQPGWRRLGVEFRVGGTLGQWATTLTETTDDASNDPLRTPENEDSTSSDDDDDDGTSERLRRFGWARILFEPGLVVSAHARLAIGAGLGVGFSLPFRNDRDLTNKSFTFIWSPSIDFRFRLRNWVRLIIQFRGVFGEEAFTRNTSETDQNRTDRARSLLTLFGLQASF